MNVIVLCVAFCKQLVGLIRSLTVSYVSDGLGFIQVWP